MANVPWEIDDTQSSASVPWEIDDTKGKALPKTGAQIMQHASIGSSDVTLKNVASGAKHAWDRAAYGLEKLVTGKVAPAHMQEIEAGRASDAVSPGSMGGAIAFDMLANPMAKAKLLPALVGAAGYGALAGNAEGNAAEGAAYGALGTAGGSAAGSMLGRIVNPSGAISPIAQKLADKGVPLTPGQLGSPGLNTVEKLLNKVPLLRDVVTARQKEASTAIVKQLGKETGLPIPASAETGRDVVQALEAGMHKSYADAIAAVHPASFAKFTPSETALQVAVNKVPTAMAREAKAITADMLKATNVIKTAPSGKQAGEAWKAIDSDLGTLGQQHPSFDAIKDVWREAYHSAVGPAASKKMLDSDLAFSQVDAMKKALAAKTEATPLQIVQALRRQDISPDNVMRNARKFSPGGTELGQRAASMNDFAEAANEMVTKPASHYGIGQLATALGLGGAYGSVLGATGAATTGLGTAAGLYSKPMLKYTTGQLGEKQRIAARFLREGSGKTAARKFGTAALIEENK